MQRDRQGGARLLDLAGHRDVFGGGRGATARMVMDQDDRGRVLFEGAFHEFARVDWHVVYGRVARDLIGDQPVAVVEIQNPRLLGPLPRQYRGQLSYQIVPVVRDRPIHHFGRGRADVAAWAILSAAAPDSPNPSIDRRSDIGAVSAGL